MASTRSIRIANDNIPERVAPSTQLRKAGHLLDGNSLTAQNTSDSMETEYGTKHSGSTESLMLSLGCWAAAILFMIIAFGFNFGTSPKIFASIALLWTGLWGSYVTADHGYWRLSELSVISALAGLMAVTIATANFFGLGLTLPDGLILMSIFSLIISYLLKSRICVLASICASLIWGVLSFSGLAETFYLMLAFPLICAAQLFVGTKIRSGLAITLAVITGYYWVTNFMLTAWNTDNLPLTFAAAALFAIGTAHHRSGKAIEDKGLTGSAIHIYAGWIAAIVGAIGFQYFWLNPEAVQNSTATLSVSGLMLWKSVILTSLAVIFCSAIIRYKYTQISLAGIFLLTLASAIIPMMLWFPALPQQVAASIPGLNAIPSIGIFIGAVITATALGMTLNGVRRHSFIMMGLGMTALLAQAYLLMKPELMTVDNSIIFISGFLASLAVGATIAGSSLSHQAPAPRLKHA